VTILAVLLWMLSARSAPALTEEDWVLIADFTNETAEPVFDGTLKQALAIHVEQSPYFNVVSPQRVSETLTLMNRPPDAPVTREVARDVAERRGITAVIHGIIAPLGSQYVITLEAVNARTGDTLAREQVQAASRETVLEALGRGATGFRKKLGESVASAERFDQPLPEATTSSLQALKLYAEGRTLVHRAKHADAIPFFTQALELDPSFVGAHTALAAVYGSIPGYGKELVTHASRAYELRDRATERERYMVSYFYFADVSGELVRARDVLKLAVRTYPRGHAFRNNLAYTLLLLGQYEEAVSEADEGLRLQPDSGVLYSNLGWAQRALGRYDEAKKVFAAAHGQGLDYSMMRVNLLLIAFAEGGREQLHAQMDSSVGGSPDAVILAVGAVADLFSGRHPERRFAAALDAAPGLFAAFYATLGECERAMRLWRATSFERDPDSLRFEAWIAPAMCAEVTIAESLLQRLTALPSAGKIRVSGLALPITRSLLHLRHGRPDEAYAALQPARALGMGQIAHFWPTYLSGMTRLARGAYAEARDEFDTIIARRSVAPNDPLYPLSYLGAARAAAQGGDTAGARSYYEALLTLWKDGDPSIRAVAQARQEYERLK
jgi:eukaryotic-like serine/threonine-protein kinase